MSKLEELEKHLYGKEKEEQEQVEKRLLWRVIFPRTLLRLPLSWIGLKRPPSQEHPRVPIFPRLIKLLLILVIPAAIVVGAVFVFLYIGTRGTEAHMEIITGDTVEAGTVLTLPIVVRNVSRTVLKEGEIVIVLPEGTVVQEGSTAISSTRRVQRIDDLGPGEQATVELPIRLFGKEDDEQTIHVNYLYRPENLRAKFTTRVSKTIKIITVPLIISWDIPEKFSRGQAAEITVRYILESRLPFERMSIRLQYPPGFTFSSAEPPPSSDDSIWEIGRLEPQREGIITLKGIITGDEGERKGFRAALGTYDPLTKDWRPFRESSKEVTIAVRPLAVHMTAPNVGSQRIISFGERVSFLVTYKNNTEVIIRDVTIRAFLDGGIVEKQSVSADNGGVADFRADSLVWGPGGTPELREISPGGSGAVQFTVETKNRPVVRSEADQNLIVRARATIESVTIPSQLQGTDLRSEDTLELKVRSLVIFDGKTAHRSSTIAQSGPLPPRVGEKTTYSIIWELRNFTNDIENAEIVASLPPNVSWENVYRPEYASITYDASSGLIRMRIGRLEAGTGVLTPALSIAFQVGIIPAISDRSKVIILVKNISFSGIDTFTKEKKRLTIPDLTTELQGDSGANPSDFIVQ